MHASTGRLDSYRGYSPDISEVYAKPPKPRGPKNTTTFVAISSHHLSYAARRILSKSSVNEAVDCDPTGRILKMPADPSAKSRKRSLTPRRGAIACVRCKERKAKCTPAPPGASRLPTCLNCLNSKSTCVYLDRTPNEIFLLE